MDWSKWAQPTRGWPLLHLKYAVQLYPSLLPSAIGARFPGSWASRTCVPVAGLAVLLITLKAGNVKSGNVKSNLDGFNTALRCYLSIHIKYFVNVATIISK